jgi:hypothetical protein
VRATVEVARQLPVGRQAGERRDKPACWCVQRRLVHSAGSRPARVRVRTQRWVRHQTSRRPPPSCAHLHDGRSPDPCCSTAPALRRPPRPATDDLSRGTAEYRSPSGLTEFRHQLLNFRACTSLGRYHHLFCGHRATSTKTPLRETGVLVRRLQMIELFQSSTRTGRQGRSHACH